MKTLYIVRHAKSSWDLAGITDFDRPLNERGKRDAPRMAKRLKEKRVNPDLMLSSPAKRALSTCKRFAEGLGYAKDKIKTERGLYHADEDEIAAFIFGGLHQAGPEIALAGQVAGEIARLLARPPRFALLPP